MVCGYLPFEDTTTMGLYTKILSGTFPVPDFLSKSQLNAFLICLECVDCLKKILMVNPVERATIQQIKDDPWFSMLNFKEPLINQLEPQLNQDILQIIESKYKLNKDLIIKDLQKNNHNSQTALYCLLIKQKAKEIKQQEISQKQQIFTFSNSIKKSNEQENFIDEIQLPLEMMLNKKQKSVNLQSKEVCENQKQQSVNIQKEQNKEFLVNLKYKLSLEKSNKKQTPKSLNKKENNNNSNTNNQSAEKHKIILQKLNKTKQVESTTNSNIKKQFNIDGQSWKAKENSFCYNKKTYIKNYCNRFDQKKKISNTQEIQNQEQLSQMISEQQQLYRLSQQQKNQLHKIADMQRQASNEQQNRSLRNNTSLKSRIYNKRNNSSLKKLHTSEKKIFQSTINSFNYLKNASGNDLKNHFHKLIATNSKNKKQPYQLNNQSINKKTNKLTPKQNINSFAIMTDRNQKSPPQKYVQINSSKPKQFCIEQYAQQIIGELNSFKKNKKSPITITQQSQISQQLKVKHSKSPHLQMLSNKNQKYLDTLKNQINLTQSRNLKANQTLINQSMKADKLTKNQNSAIINQNPYLFKEFGFRMKKQNFSREQFLKQVLQQQIIQVNNTIVINKNGKSKSPISKL